VAAWLVNALVRHRPREIEQLLAVGRALRDAQGALDAASLRDLGRQRQAVLAAVTRQARSLADEQGRPVTEAVLAEVTETLRAALADPAAAAAVRSGRLTAGLHYAGFGDDAGFDGDGDGAGAGGGAVRGGDGGPGRAVVPRTGPALAPGQRAPSARTSGDAGDGRSRAALREATLAVSAAEDAARRAEGAALAAEQHRDTLLRRAGTARERLESAHARVAELESLLSSARAATSTAAAAWAPLHAEAEAAAARADGARGLAGSAQAMLAAARAHLAGVRATPDEGP